MRQQALALSFVCSLLFGNPYPDPNKVPLDIVPPRVTRVSAESYPRSIPCCRSLDVLRVQFDWHQPSDTFSSPALYKEHSGTPALFARSAYHNPLGSYHGILLDASTYTPIAYDALGTGQEFRLLTRALTFRFPFPQTPVVLKVTAENPVTGVQEEIFSQIIDPSTAQAIPTLAVESRVLKNATENSLKVNFYSDGYSASRKETFFQDSERAINALQSKNFPGFSRMEFHAVFFPSNTALGSAKNLGLPVKERDSFLGLYYPYWDNFGRWYNIVYPTREKRYRDGIGQVPYDYPIVLIDNANYWGVGNFNEVTAIPTQHPSFTYLLTHEFGHYFGLNEEYEGGGPTELRFAPHIDEPWSQNITFLREPTQLKWSDLISSSQPVPTPKAHWTSGNYGAYLGGYADTEPLHASHKPGFKCTMENGSAFCPICRRAIEQKIAFDLH